MDFIKKNGAGLLLCLCIAIPAWLLGQAVPVVGGPVFSILIGMVLTLIWKDKTKVQPGIGFTSKKVLQYAVILLGFGLNLSEIAKVGAQSLPIIISTIGTSLIVSFVLCKAMKVPSNISTLVGVGSSICGGSAIAATAPVIGADDEEIAQAISVIFLFNVIAALTFPTLGGMLGMTDHGFGLFAGTAPALAHLLVLLLLELQRLLRFGADADLRGLPSGFSLCPFGIAVCRLYGSLNSRTELQSVVVPQQVNQQLRLLRFCAEGYLCHG